MFLTFFFSLSFVFPFKGNIDVLAGHRFVQNLHFISEIQVASTRMRKLLSDILSNIFKEIIRKLVVLFKMFF